MKMSPGWWLVYVNVIYLIVAFANLWYFKFTTIELIQLIYFVVLASPLFIKPLGNWVGVKMLWE
jgi:hypothetical protein